MPIFRGNSFVLAVAVSFVCVTMILSVVLEQLSERERDRRREKQRG
ncbi:MAG: hypothetical protein QOG84_1998 [Sphingomonadales bacterium]|jgi:hypothetical protein|nr:hypothetical protein [Sphingomonadales bacterium]